MKSTVSFDYFPHGAQMTHSIQFNQSYFNNAIALTETLIKPPPKFLSKGYGALSGRVAPQYGLCKVCLQPASRLGEEPIRRLNATIVMYPYKGPERR
jgi:hypothetical protein